MADSVDGWVKGQGVRANVMDTIDKAKRTAGSGVKYGKDFMRGLTSSPDNPSFDEIRKMGNEQNLWETRDEMKSQAAGDAARPAMRSTPVQPAAPSINPSRPGINPAAGALGAEGTAMVPYDPVVGRAHGPHIPDQTLRSNPGTPGGAWGEGISPEAKAFQAGKGATPNAAAARAPQYINDATKVADPAKVADVAKPGLIRRGLSGAGRLATPIVGTMGAVDALQHGTSTMDDTISLEMDKAVGNEGVGSPENQNRRRALGASAVNLTRRIGNAFDPSPIWGGQANMGDKAVGGIRDIIQGNPFGTTQFEPNKPAAPTQAPQTGSIASAPVQPAQPKEEAGLDFSGPRDSYGMPPLPKNATPKQAQQWLNASQGMAELKSQHRMGEQGGGGIRGGGGGDGLSQLSSLYEGKTGNARGIGGLAALAGYGALTRLNQADIRNQQAHQKMAIDVQGKNAELGLRDDTNTIAAKKVTLDAFQSNRDYAAKQRESNAKSLDTELEQQAVAGTDNSPGLFTKDSEYKAAVGKTKSDLANRLNYSVADRHDGKRADEIEPAERQQLFQLEGMRKNMEKGRGSFWQSASDYFGNKRFDSKNLYSYQPVSAKRTATGKYDIKMANGNSVSVEALAKGGFNLLGPNEPIDSNMMELIKPLIKKAEGK